MTWMISELNTQQDAQPGLDLEGRTALVTGASRGIGFGIAQALVSRGVRVCITGRDRQALKDAVESLGPDRATSVAGTVHDEEHRAATVAHVMDSFGRLDYLVNNAAASPPMAPLADLDLSVVRKIYETNVVSALGFTQEVWRSWQKENGGAVVNIASLAAFSASPLIGAYGMSKAALVNLTQQLAQELAPRVRVNAIAPGLIKTRFSTGFYDGREERAAKAHPLGRLGTPQDIAEAAVFLLSDGASWITGQTLVADGGIRLNVKFT